MMTMSLHSTQGSPLGAKALVWSAVSHCQLQTEPALEIAPAASVQGGRRCSARSSLLCGVCVCTRTTHTRHARTPAGGPFQHCLGPRGESGVLSRSKSLTKTPTLISNTDSQSPDSQDRGVIRACFSQQAGGRCWEKPPRPHNPTHPPPTSLMNLSENTSTYLLTLPGQQQHGQFSGTTSFLI